MPELKVHDPTVASIQRKTGQKGYWRIHKDGTEEFVEDKPMTNPRSTPMYNYAPWGATLNRLERELERGEITQQQYKDESEKIIEERDRVMKNPRVYGGRENHPKYKELKKREEFLYRAWREEIKVSGENSDTSKQKEKMQKEALSELSEWKIRNPRKKERELRKPERPGNYQKIMKEIDEKPNEWRFRLIPPGKLHEDSFRSIEITRGVRAITGCRKGFWSGSRCDKGVEIQALRLSKSVFNTKESAAKWVESHTMTKY